MENFINVFNTLTYYPTGFFLLFFCLLLAYWLLSIIGGVDQNLGFDFDVDIDADNIGFLTHLFISMGLAKVPLSIGLTFASFYGVFIAGLIQTQGLSLLFDFNNNFNAFDITYLLLSTIVFFFTFFTSLWLAGKTVKPLIPLFDEDGKSLTFEYIGSEGTVESSKVTDTFGDVVIKNEEHEYLITVYLADYDKENVVRGDKVRVVLFNEETQRYLVQKIQ